MLGRMLDHCPAYGGECALSECRHSCKAQDEALRAKAELTRPAHEFVAALRDKERARIRAEALEEAAKVADTWRCAAADQYAMGRDGCRPRHR